MSHKYMEPKTEKSYKGFNFLSMAQTKKPGLKVLDKNQVGITQWEEET